MIQPREQLEETQKTFKSKEFADILGKDSEYVDDNSISDFIPQEILTLLDIIVIEKEEKTDPVIIKTQSNNSCCEFKI